MADYETLQAEELATRLDQRGLKNDEPREGLALVNVLPPESHAKEHLPGSINIPKGQEERFEERFEKDKELVVYCASESCSASPTVAENLTRRGFTNVKDFAGGLKEWKEEGRPIAGGAAPGASASA